MPTLETWPDSGTIATVASIAAAFAATILVLRIQRELQIRADRVATWIPPADRLLPAPFCAAVLVLLTAYPFASLAHYRFVLAKGVTGPRGPAEPGELLVVKIASIASVLAFSWAVDLRVA